MNNSILKLEGQEPHRDAGREVLNLRSVRRRTLDDRRQAAREGDIDRRSGQDRRSDGAGTTVRQVRTPKRPVINRAEQLARLRLIQDLYYGVRVTRARCRPAVKLLDVVFSFYDVPSLPLPDCTETCTCQYQGVKNQRLGVRRLGPPERRRAVRKGVAVRRTGTGRRQSDSAFVFYIDKG